MPNTWLKNPAIPVSLRGANISEASRRHGYQRQFNYTHSVLMNQQVKDFLDSAQGVLSSLALAL